MILDDKYGTKPIQLKLLNMMTDVSIVLEENNIAYSLSAGSLLGAVRHKGFIPWDDDIDIMVDRENYNKLLKVFENGYVKNGNICSRWNAFSVAKGSVRQLRKELGDSTTPIVFFSRLQFNQLLSSIPKNRLLYTSSKRMYFKEEVNVYQIDSIEWMRNSSIPEKRENMKLTKQSINLGVVSLALGIWSVILGIVSIFIAIK